MNPQYLILLAVAGIMVVMFLFVAIWANRYVKVGPNQVLVVSGRRRLLPDGRYAGFRFVRGGGTFVLPVIEKAEVLSLEVVSIEMPKLKVRTAQGVAVEVDCLAQIKIKGEDMSILAAAEHFLSKSAVEIKNVVRPILEKHLRTNLGSKSIEEIGQDLERCAARVQDASSADLGKMGLSVISLTIQNVRTG